MEDKQFVLYIGLMKHTRNTRIKCQMKLNVENLQYYTIVYITNKYHIYTIYTQMICIHTYITNLMYDLYA